jgi:hypothetical protein
MLDPKSKIQSMLLILDVHAIDFGCSCKSACSFWVFMLLILDVHVECQNRSKTQIDASTLD